MKQSIVYTLARYGGDKELAFEALADRFYRENTGNGETRNPKEVEDLKGYTPPIQRGKRETLSDYRIRQLDYWIKNVAIRKRPFWRRIKIMPYTELVWRPNKKNANTQT